MQVEEVCQYNVQNNKLHSVEKDDYPADLKDDIKIIAKSEGFVKYNVKVKKLPVDGGNYMAELYEIDISGITTEGEKEINIFAKQINLGSGTLESVVNISELFKLEKFAYKELYQVFNEIQENAKVPADERYRMVKCYDSNPGAILMANLRKQGYKTYSRIDVVSLDFAEKAIKNLAKFHALSFAMENIKPDFFDCKIKTLNCPLSFGEELRSLQKSLFSIAMSNLDYDLRNRVKDNIFNKLCKYRDYFEKPEISWLCHGDYRVMNMMIRDVDGKIEDLIALDYQIINYGNPLKDLIYFIFTATDRKFRKSHLSYLKDTYYKQLEYFLKYFDLDVDHSLPREKFERIYEETLDYGLIIMITIAPFMFADEGDVPDVANVSMSSLDFKVDDAYKNYLRDIVEDFIDWGYL
ncbi:hypothetical protein K1T71_005898 [Dendrolimus kikuchii]|uniref:Uncharacterized protein n=1 Tax=Dendrolimus kikuchii TaxID=765133 RepID=A0ACC1D2M9_9NEOP|nr:hypothetical protein K1T71_005898 [Dendrolimus kikuchii]